MNSSVKTGSWFSKQHDYDEAPTIDKVTTVEGVNGVEYAGDPGFLAGFSPEVLQHFTTITNITGIPTPEVVGQETSETTDDKVFLPSYTEITGYSNAGVLEGSQLSISRAKTGAGSIYCMRSPAYDDTSTVWNIFPDGSDLGGPAYDSNNGITPIIVLH